MSVQTNVNENPKDSQPYVPPGQTQTITNDPDHNKVKQSGGGVSSGGSTVILTTDSLIQSTADSGGIPGARTSLADNASDASRFARSGTPALPTPDLDVNMPDFSQLAMGGIDSLVRSFTGLSGVLFPTPAPTSTPTTPGAPTGLSSSIGSAPTSSEDPLAPGADATSGGIAPLLQGMASGLVGDALLAELAGSISAATSQPTTAPTPAAAAPGTSTVGATAGSSATGSTTGTTQAANTTQAASSQSTTNMGIPVDPLTDAELSQVSELSSNDPNTIKLYLNTLGLTSDQVDTLAAAMSRANRGGEGVPGLNSTDISIIMTALANVLGLTPTEVAGLRGVAEKIQGLNEKVQANMHSTDPVVVGRVLSAQVDATDLSPPEKSQMQSYLTLLAAALAFMAEIQCTITQLEGKIKMAYMDAKNQSAQEATQVAIDTAKKNTDAIQQNVEAKIAQIEAMKKAKLWKWLGPVITALVAIVAIVAIVGTAGAATAPAIAGVSAAVAATTVTATTVALVTVTILLTTIAILDQTTDFTDKIADACNVPKDSASRQAFKAGFHMLIAIILVVCTAGLAAPAAAASVAAQESASQAATTTAMVTTQATVKTLSQLNTMLIMSIIQPLFTSGLVGTAFSELYLLGKKPANADQQRDAMIFSTCMTIVAMIVVTAGVGKMVSTGEQGMADFAGKQAAAQAAEDGASAGSSAGSAAVRDRGLTLVEEAADHADDAAGAANAAGTAAEAGSASATAATVVDEAQQSAKSMTERFLDMVQKNIIAQFQKEIQILEQLLKLVQGATQAAASFQTYQAQTSQAEANDVQAGLQRELGKLNAALSFITSQLPNFDKTTANFDKDIQKFAEFVTSFADQVKDFIAAAQRASTQLRNSV